MVLGIHKITQYERYMPHRIIGTIDFKFCDTIEETARENNLSRKKAYLYMSRFNGEYERVFSINTFKYRKLTIN